MIIHFISGLTVSLHCDVFLVRIIGNFELIYVISTFILRNFRNIHYAE